MLYKEKIINKISQNLYLFYHNECASVVAARVCHSVVGYGKPQELISFAAGSLYADVC